MKKFIFYLIPVIFILMLFNSCGGGSSISITSPSPVPSQAPTVSPTQIPTPSADVTWTVMVYMNGNSTLENITDIKKDEILSLTSTSQVNIVMEQAKSSQGGRAKRYYAGSKDPVENLSVTDMASPDNLKDFILWSKKNYPADYYILNIFTHGGGWKGLLRDEVSGHAMDVKQLQQALSNDGRVDIISFSSCSMGNVEVACQLRDVSDILISSQDDVPVTGWPYDIIFNSLIKNPRQNPAGFSITVTDNYIRYYNDVKMTNMTLSALDLKKISPLMNNFKELSTVLMNKPDIYEEIRNDREKSLLFYNKNYVDISTFVQSLSSISEVNSISSDIINNLNNAIIISKKTDGSSTASGMSLYFPPSAGNLQDYNGNSYTSLDFGYNSNWGDFLYRINP
ncbi:MAG: clostripain-related cysteine peptidase [Candidatus Eremiobacterota bacterium]